MDDRYIDVFTLITPMTKHDCIKKLNDGLVFPTLHDYSKPHALKFFRRAAQKYIDPVVVYEFSTDEGDRLRLWVHIAVAEAACEALGSRKALASHLVAPTILSCETKIKAQNLKLNPEERRRLALRSEIIRQAYYTFVEHKTWIERVKKIAGSSFLFEDEHDMLTILVNLIGIEYVLTGVQT